MIDIEDISFENVLEEGFGFMTEQIEDKKEDKTQSLFPILPVRDMVMFPKIIMPITAGREKSIMLLKEAYRNNQSVGIISQKTSKKEEPSEDDLFSVGTTAQILKIIKLPDGNVTAIMKGTGRFKLKKIAEKQPFFKAEIERLKDTSTRKKEEYEALIENIKDLAVKIIELDPQMPNSAVLAIKNMENQEELLNYICGGR